MKHAEDNLQIACVAWFSLQYPDIAGFLHHSPNGGLRNLREAARFKAMGTRAGFPDLILLIPNAQHPFLCVEMKSAKGRQTEYQKRYQELVEIVGAKYIICRDLDNFVSEINRYLSKKQLTVVI